MERQNPTPESHSDLHDPKLPVIRSGPCGNRAQAHVCTGPVPGAKPDMTRRDRKKRNFGKNCTKESKYRENRAFG